jgi:hypothetical protein
VTLRVLGTETATDDVDVAPGRSGSLLVVMLLTTLVVACDSSDPPDATPELVPCDMPAASRPTVVLVHGAWADTSSWDGEVASLQDSGYEARAIANPLEDLTTVLRPSPTS